jgi:hypothetical protein
MRLHAVQDYVGIITAPFESSETNPMTVSDRARLPLLSGSAYTAFGFGDPCFGASGY